MTLPLQRSWCSQELMKPIGMNCLSFSVYTKAVEHNTCFHSLGPDALLLEQMILSRGYKTWLREWWKKLVPEPDCKKALDGTQIYTYLEKHIRASIVNRLNNSKQPVYECGL